MTHKNLNKRNMPTIYCLAENILPNVVCNKITTFQNICCSSLSLHSGQRGLFVISALLYVSLSLAHDHRITFTDTHYVGYATLNNKTIYSIFIGNIAFYSISQTGKQQQTTIEIMSTEKKQRYRRHVCDCSSSGRESWAPTIS